MKYRRRRFPRGRVETMGTPHGYATTDFPVIGCRSISSGNTAIESFFDYPNLPNYGKTAIVSVRRQEYGETNCVGFRPCSFFPSLPIWFLP